MKHGKMKEAELDCLINLGEIVQEIRFSALPDETVWEALCDNSKGICIHLPLDKPFTFGGMTNSPVNEHIISANYETDIFIDSGYLFEYPNLKHLVLTCSNVEVEEIDAKDLGDMWLAVSELQNIATLKLDVRRMKLQAVEQIKCQFIFPGRDLEVEFIEQPKRRKRMTRKH